MGTALGVPGALGPRPRGVGPHTSRTPLGRAVGAAIAEDGRSELGAEDAFLFARVGEDDAVGIDDEGTSRIGVVGFGAATVHADDVGQVFSRPRFQ